MVAKLRGYKTPLAIVLLTLMFLDKYLAEVVPLLPEYSPQIEAIKMHLIEIISALTWLATKLGLPVTVAAMVDNKVQQKKVEKEVKILKTIGDSLYGKVSN